MDVVSRPEAGGGTAVADAVPVRASGVELLGEMSHSGYREPPRLARRADGQVLQLTALLYSVLSAIDGKRDLQSIAQEVTSKADRRLTADDVAYLINEKLVPLGVLKDAEGRNPVVQKANPLLALRWRVVVSKPEATAALTRPFTWLFRPPVVLFVLGAFVASVGWVLLERGLGNGLRSMLYDPRQLLLVVGLTALSAGFHEFGHAAACRYGGATPGAMGAGIYLVWPAFYTDVTDSYRLDRRGRLRTDLGGLYFNCIFTIVTVGIGAATGADALLVLVPLQLLQMVHQLVPILRLDGYHILADLTGVPDLYGRIRPTLHSALPGTPVDERAAALRPGVRRIVTAWVVVIVPVLIFFIGSAALALPRILATAGDSLSMRWDHFAEAWTRSDVFSMLTALLAMFTLVLPIAGTVLILQRIATRTWRYLWDRFEGPAARTLLGGAALATAIGILLALWPHGNYRVIEPGERLVAQDLPVVRAVATRQIGPILEPARSPSAAERRTESASTGRGGSSRTVEGDDNLAMAVNTADGASVFRLAFAVRSIADGSVDQTNSAIALASCTDCTTVALAFQVLLIFNDPASLTPENRAVAVNVACTACVTFASATQLILGFSGPMELTDEGERRIGEVHQSLLSLEGRADSLSAEELAAEVEAAKAELAAIFDEELMPAEDEAEPDEEEPDGEDDADATRESETIGDEDSEESTRRTTSSTSSSTSTSSTSSSTSSTTSTTAG